MTLPEVASKVAERSREIQLVLLNDAWSVWRCAGKIWTYFLVYPSSSVALSPNVSLKVRKDIRQDLNTLISAL